MATEIKLPELGENVEAGDVINVLVSVGDTIEADQAILEVETGKATLDVPASDGGTIKEIKVSAGDKVTVGQVLMVVEGGGSAAGGGEKKAEDAPKKDDAAKTEEPAKQDEKPAKQEQAESAPAASESAPKKAAGAGSKGEGGAIDPSSLIPAAPQVRRVARQLGVELEQVRGSGPNGRVTVEDVKSHVKGIVQSGGGSAGGGGGSKAGTPSLPDLTKFGDVRIEKMSQVRTATAQHIATCWNIPMVTQNDKADITALEEFRKSYGKRVEKAGGKLTMTAILLKLCALAIQKFPKFGCSIDPAKGEIVYKDYIHIGVAVDTPRGLVVPVIRDVDKKSITQCSIELGEAATKARDGKLRSADIHGGCFSISNIGGIGGTFFSPIVNWPEVAILGVARAETEARWIDGAFQPRLMAPLSVTYDHRIIDGADTARFLRYLAEGLENPMSALL